MEDKLLEQNLLKQVLHIRVKIFRKEKKNKGYRKDRMAHVCANTSALQCFPQLTSFNSNSQVSAGSNDLCSNE